MNINFAFVRHGHGCHNALKPLRNYKLISSTKEFNNIDPELSPLGVDASIRNGCIISNIIRNIHQVVPNAEQIDNIDIVGSSPLIRAMETAYYMTRNWKTPPKKIFVLPILREIDEGAIDKYSFESFDTMNKEPVYAMKTIKQQKAYLESQGILQYFDFSYVEKYISQRIEPGDIRHFIRWFVENFLPSADRNLSKKQLNVFITTHAGVLRDYADEGFVNNDGFLLNTYVFNNYQIKYNNFILFKPYLPSSFFKEYSSEQYATAEYYCPSGRCGNLCNVLKSSGHNRIDNSCTDSKK